jgi:GxxExxY protein
LRGGGFLLVLTAEDTETTEITYKINEITEIIIGAAIAVHRELGPGLLESAYEACLAYEPAQRGLKVELQKPLPVAYHQVRLDCGYRIDMLVEDKVIIELKAVEKLEPIHEAQLLSYLKLSGCSVGLLINFNVRVLKHGIKRLVHNLGDPLQREANQMDNLQ